MAEEQRKDINVPACRSILVSLQKELDECRSMLASTQNNYHQWDNWFREDQLWTELRFIKYKMEGIYNTFDQNHKTKHFVAAWYGSKVLWVECDECAKVVKGAKLISKRVIRI